jgi:hypothetical protein
MPLTKDIVTSRIINHKNRSFVVNSEEVFLHITTTIHFLVTVAALLIDIKTSSALGMKSFSVFSCIIVSYSPLKLRDMSLWEIS